MPVLHAEAVGDLTEHDKAEPFIKVSGVNVRVDHGVELHEGKAVRFGLDKAILHQRLTEMLSALAAFHHVARVSDVAASSDVVRMQDIKPHDAPRVILRNGRIGLRGEEALAAFHREALLLRKRLAVLNDLISKAHHFRHVALTIVSDKHINSSSSFQIFQKFIRLVPRVENEHRFVRVFFKQI